MSSAAATMVISDEAERLRKEAKKAKKAEKKARKATEGAAAAAASPDSSPAPAEEEPAAELSDEERVRQEEKKRRKAEKRARKQAEGSGSVVPLSSPSPSPSPVSSPDSTSGSFSFPSSSSPLPSCSPMTPNRKVFYRQHPEVASLPSTKVAAIRGESKMTLSGNMYGKDALYNPVTKFAQAGFSKALLKCTEGFSAPTGIQAQCWPVLLMGRDAIAIAETGSGKTLGFVLPALVHILDAAPLASSRKGGVENMGPIALVLAPTRELAMQSAEVAEKAAKDVNLNTAVIYGGVEKYVQRQALTKGVHLMVATPGRLLSLMNDGEVSLKRVTFIVLDEADRMLDLGFEPDIRAIIGACPGSQERQTLMFSATWPESVKALAASFIVDPLRITIGKDEEEMKTDTLAANKRITQRVEVIDDFKRDSRLVQLLQEHTKGAKPAEHKKILVFVLYKKEVDKVERLLRSRGFEAVGMSSDKNQSERTAAIENFKNGKVRMLVATDVAGRGLDISDIALVINYSFPLTVEDYVHRIGRTGRGGKSGEAITFFTRNDKNLSGELINVLRDANQPVPEDLMKFGTGVKRKAHSMYGAHFKAQDEERPMKQAVRIKFD
jgi:ATP-dependent RNA helicase DBP3